MKTLLFAIKAVILAAILFFSAGNASAFYDPGTQRWLNRDPIQERGGINLFGYVGNNSIDNIDSNGELWGQLFLAGLILADQIKDAYDQMNPTPSLPVMDFPTDIPSDQPSLPVNSIPLSDADKAIDNAAKNLYKCNCPSLKSPNPSQPSTPTIEDNSLGESPHVDPPESPMAPLPPETEAPSWTPSGIDPNAPTITPPQPMGLPRQNAPGYRGGPSRGGKSYKI